MGTKKFNAFDKVIIKSQIDECWSCDLYSHLDKDTGMHETINRCGLKDEDILPYEGNEHLVGTDLPAEEEVRLEEGEWIIPADIVGVYEKVVNCIIRQFDYVEDGLIKCKNSSAWALAIRFSDFNPNDMEATKAKILCVKGGKVVKYKG